MSKLQGDIGEIALMLRAKNNSLAVLTPFSSISPYDIAIDNGKEIHRIQVKTASKLHKRHGKRVPSVYNCIISRGRDGKTRYKENEVDFFAVYIIPEDAFYIIPFNQITTKTIKIHTNKSNHRFSMYRENFNLLK